MMRQRLNIYDCFYSSQSSVHNSRTHFSRVFVSAALLVSSLLSSMSLNLLYRFSIFLLTSCKIMLALRQDIHLIWPLCLTTQIWETLMSAYRNKCGLHGGVFSRRHLALPWSAMIPLTTYTVLADQVRILAFLANLRCQYCIKSLCTLG